MKFDAAIEMFIKQVVGRIIINNHRKMTTITCDLDGYQKLVDDIIKLALVAITANVSLIELVVSGAPDLKMAV